MRNNKYNRFTSNGVSFSIRYSAYGKAQTRALVTPLDPRNGKRLTKRQLYGTDSDYPVEATLYGTTREEIYTRQVPALAADLVIDMFRAGILHPTAEYHDLYALASQLESEFLTYYQNVRHWRDTTAHGYRQQYRLMLPLLRGIRAERLDQAAYQSVCDRITQEAESTRRRDAIDEKDTSSSAQTRIFLLGLLIDYLRGVEGIEIPAVPQAQSTRASNRWLLMQQMDMAREYPADIITAFCRRLSADSPVEHLIIGIIMDTGLRIAEALGLLFGSIRQLAGPQGPQYYLMVTGQINDAGKRSVVVKTKAGYRCVPLSAELGALLWQRRERLAACCRRIDTRLFLAQFADGRLADDSTVVQQVRQRVADALRAYLDESHAFARLTALRPYTFDASVQNRQLTANMSHHSLRRNYCTDLYAQGGWSQQQIDRQMGHDNSAPARGLAPRELYALCLQKQVVVTPFHDQQPLSIPPDAADNPTVPANRLWVSVPPHSAVTVAWCDPEPGSEISSTGNGCVCINVEKLPLPADFAYRDSPLLDADAYKILRIESAFG